MKILKFVPGRDITQLINFSFVTVEICVVMYALYGFLYFSSQYDRLHHANLRGMYVSSAGKDGEILQTTPS